MKIKISQKWIKNNGILFANNGFTLVELLAVIVILAIIAVIAVPQVLKIIETSRKDAFMESVRNIIKAAKLQYMQDALKGTNKQVTYTYQNGEQTSIPVGKTLNFNGQKPNNGFIMISSDGKVTMSIYTEKYTAEKHPNKEELVIGEETAFKAVSAIAECEDIGGTHSAGKNNEYCIVLYNNPDQVFSLLKFFNS